MQSQKFIRILFLTYAICTTSASAQEPGDVDLSVHIQQKLALLESLHTENLISDRLYEQRKQSLASHSSAMRFSDKPLLQRTSADQKISNHLIDSLQAIKSKRFALVIGADKYKHYPALQSAINDAQAIANLLMSSFGFDVQLLENPDRQHLLTALSHYRRTLNSDDQFLLYYAGHGYLDKHTQRGYWLPVNAEKDNPSNWISTADISDALLALPARQALIIADSCYAGSLSSGEPVSDASAKPLDPRRSRTVITSGGLEPVLDSGANGHSVFANAFMEQLNQIRNGDSLQSVFKRLKLQVRTQAQQTPQYSIIPGAGHEHGEFTFHRS